MSQDIELINVTPALAHEYLGANTHNRSLRQSVVRAYASDMEEGNWRWNGESLKFAEDGTLLDGQHRLAAITESGVTVPMLVIRGLPHEAQETVDGGAKRKFADVLKLHAIYELRKAADASRTVRGQRSETYLTAILIKAWNAYRDGTTVGLLSYRPGGARPERFPESH